VTATPFTVGVEEEYQIVDGETYELRPRAESVLADAEAAGEDVQPELSLSQVEIGTAVCTTLAEVRAELVRLRKAVTQAASASGSRVVAIGTHPFSEWLGQGITPKERYLGLAEDYQQLAREQLICGCHVHVCVTDPELAVRTMDRMRPWLSTLLALTGTSAFWQGVDTGYSSYRTAMFDRWPMTGTPLPLGSRKAFDELVDSLVACGAIEDASKLYWDVRPSTRYETIEVRVADVCTTVDEAVMAAALARGLVRTCAGAAERDDPAEDARPELVRAARWRAARYGMTDQLVDLSRCRLVPARDQVEALLAFVRDDLESNGEWDEVRELVTDTVERGTGAQRQRRVFEQTGSLRAVVEAAADETVAGVTS
jgi:glutamate---cysteine ligase / carboxylate-amine ligase